MAEAELSNTKNENSVNGIKKEIQLQTRFKPDWDDLDKRLLPEWYDRAKVGIFLHWGVYSVPSFMSEWFWIYSKMPKSPAAKFMREHFPPNFTYQNFGPMFTTEFFDAKKWANLFKNSGAKYIVLTTKHHEGFTLFPSKRSFGWNSVDVGPHRDLVKELSTAVRAKGLKFGVYHSLYEWYNPMYLADRANSFKTRDFVTQKLFPDLKQLIEDYKPSVLWADGDWESSADYWNSTGFLSWLYTDSTVKDEIVVNERWGKMKEKHGDFYNHKDGFNPGKLLSHKWENAFKMDKRSWGYRRDIAVSDVLTLYKLINETVTTVSCGGNVLINVGPTKEGTISAIFQDRLLGLGTWLGINGEAIYASSPWRHQDDSISDKHVWYTCSKTTWDAHHPIAPPKDDTEVLAVYAMVMVWPSDNILKLKDITSYITQGTQAVLLGNEGTLKIKVNNGVTEIQFPNHATVKSQHAWTVKFTKQ